MARLTIQSPADVRLLDSGMSVGEALAAFNAAHPEAGGIATFLGKVRPDEDVRVLELTHYEPLTLPGMQQLADKALQRWPLDGVLMWHRVGVMHPGESIVLVAAAARHRRLLPPQEAPAVPTSRCCLSRSLPSTPRCCAWASRCPLCRAS